MNLMHYIIFYYCRSTKAIANIDKGRETTRGESLKALEASGWWISKCFEDPCGRLFIGSKLLQDLQLVHPWVLLWKEGTRRHEIEPARQQIAQLHKLETRAGMWMMRDPKRVT
jgi:hypothetical protein